MLRRKALKEYTIQMTTFSLKDQLINPVKVSRIAAEITAVYPVFETQYFIEKVTERLPELELKARLYWVAECLKQFLPHTYEKALAVLLHALPEPCDPHLSDDDFGDFIYASYTYFVSFYGCSEEFVFVSLNALEQLTTRFSAEDAIRPFINHFPEQTVEALTQWARHSHYHVRRLVSEGTRPKLPWAQKIAYQKDEFLNLLDILHADSTRFVTRSVANHLNDVSKTDPDAVLALLKKWQSEEKQTEKELNYIKNHSLRTLIKQGHKETLRYLGFKANPNITINICLDSTLVKMGDPVVFHVDIMAHEDLSLLVDYVMVFQGKSGKPRETVFKLKVLRLKKGERVSFSKHYVFKQQMTTRHFYPGEHALFLQINGTAVKSQKQVFFLK